MNRICVILILINACGSPPDPCPSAAARHKIHATIVTNPVPVMLAYKADQGAWQSLTVASDSQYDVCVDSSYELLAICFGTLNNTTYTSEVFGTYDDLPNPTITQSACGEIVSTPPQGLYTLAGQTRQPARVSVGEGSLLVNSGTNFTFNFYLGQGKYDLFASNGYSDLGISSGQGSVVKRPSIDLSRNVQLATIDLQSEGSGLEATSLSVSGLMADDKSTTSVTVQTTSTLATISSIDGTSANVLPAGLLSSADRETVSLLADSTSNPKHVFSRGVGSPFDPTMLSFALPARLSTVQFSATNPVSATWSPTDVSATSSLELRVWGSNALQDLVASPAWLNEQNASSLTFDESAPGWNALWDPDLSHQYIRTFVVSEVDATNGSYSSSSIIDTLP